MRRAPLPTPSAGLIFSACLLLAACADDASTGEPVAGSGAVEIQISGEDLATDGFSFPEGSEVTIVDGWEIHFDHVFVTVGRVWLSDNPDLNPGDASQTGVEVAEAVGPWAIDLAREGDRAGAAGEGTAFRLAVLDRQNLTDDAPLAADRRYAFGFDFVSANESAEALGFSDDPDAMAAYDEAVAGGYAVYYVGTATFRGTECEVSDGAYDFTRIPTTVAFRLGFDTPTHYLNCQNQENDGDPFPGEEYQRGVAIRADQAALAQITLHVEHPFYSDVQHEPAVYFDPIAALLVGQPEGTIVEMNALESLDPTGFVDGEGTPLPFRSCDGTPIPSEGSRAFETGTIPVSPAQDPSNGFRHYADFVRYVQSAQGHMNGGEGLCFIDRQYPSPR